MVKSLLFPMNNHARAIMITAAAIVLAVPSFAVGQPRLPPHATNLVPSCGFAHACIRRVACDEKLFNECVDNCMRVTREYTGREFQVCKSGCQDRFGICQ